MSINRYVATGNLVRDPELRQSQTGTYILKFSLAITDRRKNGKTGEWESYANFVDCTMFGPRAQGLFDKLCKGRKVGIEGKLHWSHWNRDGQKRSKIEVIVEDLELLGMPKERSRGEQQPSENPVRADAEIAVSDEVYDDIPM